MSGDSYLTAHIFSPLMTQINFTLSILNIFEYRQSHDLIRHEFDWWECLQVWEPNLQVLWGKHSLGGAKSAWNVQLSSRHSTFIWLFRYVTCQWYMMAFVTFRGWVLTFVTVILSYGTICHTAVCLFTLNSSQMWSSPGMSYPKRGSLSKKKRNVMFSSNFFVTLTRNDLRNLRIHSSNTRGLETWKNQPRLFVPFP